jgi:glycyl-tRNA synthetase
MPAPAAAPAAALPRGEAKGLTNAAPTAKSIDECKKNRSALDDICKRRFVYRQGSEIYGGCGGFYTYGPPGCAMKVNVIQKWRRHFVMEENLMEVEDTCIMIEPVLKASGHVDKFNDFMVKDTLDHSKYYRADKLLEEVMEAKMNEKDCTAEKKKEYEIVSNQADSYSREEIHAVFQKYGIKAPGTGNELSEPYEFNLMFPAPIGPAGLIKGYLRPETAQGIFINYKYCLEQNNNRVPFGVAQVGKAFRNEIAPRAGLTRQREFTQAEIEWFVKPTAKAHDKFAAFANIKLNFFSSPAQLEGGTSKVMTIGEAVKTKTVDNETLGYFIVRTALFLQDVGIRPELLRFRQHLPTEMAHYAKDCWDAEIGTCYGWLECVGIADRACFDLSAHGQATGEDLAVKEKLAEPIMKEVYRLTKAAANNVKKDLKQNSKAYLDYCEGASKQTLVDLKAKVDANGSAEIKVCDGSITVGPNHVLFEDAVEKTSVESYVPGVVEPSFGIDRILFSILEHAYYERPKEEGDKEVKRVLALSPVIAPYQVLVLSLDQRVARDKKYQEMVATLKRELTNRSLASTVDDSSATVGKRYSRNDELGIPYGVTIDFDTFNDQKATIRDRDTTTQIRAPLSVIPDLIQQLTLTTLLWTDAQKLYPAPAKN